MCNARRTGGSVTFWLRLVLWRYVETAINRYGGARHGFLLGILNLSSMLSLAVRHDGTYLMLWLLMVLLLLVVSWSRMVSPASDLLPRYGILHGRYGGLDWMN